LQQRAGATMGHDVWRFRLPKTPPLQPSHPKGICLTGNYFEWRSSEPVPMANAAAGGSYRLSGVSGNGAEQEGQEIPFKEGRLTDRLKGAQAANDAKTSDYLLECKAEKPWRIDWRLERPATTHTIRLFYSGKLPPGTCEVSVDGKQWRKCGEWQGGATSYPGDVDVQAIELKPAVRAAHYRLNFQPAGPSKLLLAEVDFWGDDR